MDYSGFLTEAERTDLRAVLRLVRGEALRLRRANILLLLDDGWTFQAIATAFYLETSTIEALLKAYKTTGFATLDSAPITGRAFKLDEKQQESLSLHLETANYACSKDIRAYIQETYNVVYCRSSILSFLRKLGFVHQNTQLAIPAPDEAVQQAAIEAYNLQKASLNDDEVIVHIDGVHPTHIAKTGKIWIKKGDTRHILSNTGRQRLNIHGAINLATGQFHFMNNATINAESTIQLFKKLEAAYKSQTKIYVRSDNARYHYSKPVQDWLKRPGNRIILQFLPAYCPHLNPIERLWHVLHTHTTRNKYYKTYNEFCEAIITFCKDTIPQKWDTIKSYVTDNFTVKSNKNLKLI